MDDIKYEYYKDINPYQPTKISMGEDYPLPQHLSMYRSYVGSYIGSGEFDDDVSDISVDSGVGPHLVIGSRLSRTSATTVDHRLLQLFHAADNPAVYIPGAKASKPHSRKTVRRGRGSAGNTIDGGMGGDGEDVWSALKGGDEDDDSSTDESTDTDGWPDDSILDGCPSPHSDHDIGARTSSDMSYDGSGSSDNSILEFIIDPNN